MLHLSLADLVSCVPTSQGRSGKEINFHEILFCCIVKACIGNKYVVVPKLCSIKPLLESFSQFSPPSIPFTPTFFLFQVLTLLALNASIELSAIPTLLVLLALLALLELLALLSFLSLFALPLLL